MYPYGFRNVEFNGGSSYDVLKTPYPTSVSQGQNFSAGLDGGAAVAAVHHVPPTVRLNNKSFNSGLPTNSHKLLFPVETPQKVPF